MKKLNVYNPIYDQILKEIKEGVIKPGFNCDFGNYKYRIEKIENDNYTKNDIIALLISGSINQEASSFIVDKINKIYEKVMKNEELEDSEVRFVFEYQEATDDYSIISEYNFDRNIAQNIPRSLRSNDIIINSMYFQNTFDYVKEHIGEFDRQFFKRSVRKLKISSFKIINTTN